MNCLITQTKWNNVLDRMPECVRCGVLYTEANSQLTQKIIWRDASCENPGKVVGNFAYPALGFQNNRLGFEFNRLGVKNHLDASLAHAVIQPLGVALFDANKSLLPIRERHGISALVGQPHSGLYRAISTANDKN